MDSQDGPWTILSNTLTKYLGLGSSRHPNFWQLICVCVFHVLAADGDIGPHAGKGDGSSIAGRKVDVSGSKSAKLISAFKTLMSWLWWVVMAVGDIITLVVVLLVVLLAGMYLYGTWKLSRS
jgi:hypothetical protein